MHWNVTLFGQPVPLLLSRSAAEQIDVSLHLHAGDVVHVTIPKLIIPSPSVVV